MNTVECHTRSKIRLPQAEVERNIAVYIEVRSWLSRPSAARETSERPIKEYTRASFMR
jgi:hypothetical protein